MLAIDYIGAINPAPTTNGYDQMKPINTMVVEVLRDHKVPDTFINTYLKEIPLDSHDFDTVAHWWADYLKEFPHASSISFYLRNIRTPISWVNEFSKSVPKLIQTQY